MFDNILKAKVNREVGRINGELCDLKELEESTRIRRARLEVEMRQAIAVRDMFELFGRLDKQTTPVVVRYEPVMPEHPSGPQFAIPAIAEAKQAVVAAISPEEPPTKSRTARKPDTPPKPEGSPTTRQMVTTVLEHFSPKFLQPRQIEAVVRQEWWPDVPPHRIASCAWDMAKHGMIEKRGSKYRVKLNGHAQEAPKPQSAKEHPNQSQPKHVLAAPIGLLCACFLTAV